MNSAQNFPSKKHVVITLEPLNAKESETGKVSSRQQQQQQIYPSTALAELLRQQRKRCVKDFMFWFLWILIVLLVASAGFGIYYFSYLK